MQAKALEHIKQTGVQSRGKSYGLFPAVPGNRPYVAGIPGKKSAEEVTAEDIQKLVEGGQRYRAKV